MDKKIIAFYLPQYHEIPENNDWWGKGFTEWTNVKRASKLKAFQNQPRKPLNNYYYTLDNNDPFYKQISWAKKYGVDGFSFYHYWFKGKQLLEKPVERYLNDPECDLPFCLTWANEPWTRAWDGLTRDILQEQSYGGFEDWKKHFDYLAKFFLDPLYIRKDNKPLFLIYKSFDIPDLDKMLNFFNEEAKKIGLKGIYIIEILGGVQSKSHSQISKAVLEFEPNFTMAFHNKNWFTKAYFDLKKKLNKGLSIYNYNFLIKEILNRQSSYNSKKVYKSLFVGWDNTPRKGSKGVIVKNSSPLNFGKAIKSLNKSYNEEFIFINAWNEWAEGTYLEPDTLNNFKFLEEIKFAKER